MKLLNLTRKLCEIPDIERKLFIKGYFLSGLLFILLKILPLRFYFKIIKSSPTYSVIDAEKDSHIRIVVKSIKRIKRFSLWNCTCLNQVLTLKVLCNKIGIQSEVRFLVFNNNSAAHAYLTIDNNLNFLALNNVKGINLRTV